MINLNYKDILEMKQEDRINLFKKMYDKYITRDGKDKIMDFINKSDFYKAPASTRFHSSIEGGLLLHSILVTICLFNKRQNPIWNEFLKDTTDETLFFVAMMHDICKTYFYSPTWKNVKVYHDGGMKKDAGGAFDWETQQGWEIDDKYPLGHGEKSCFFLQNMTHLSVEEYSAIRWHMGFADNKDNWGYIGTSMEKYPLVLALHEADLEASKLLEI